MHLSMSTSTGTFSRSLSHTVHIDGTTRRYSIILYGTIAWSISSTGCHHNMGTRVSAFQRSIYLNEIQPLFVFRYRLLCHHDRFLYGLLLQCHHRVVVAFLLRFLHHVAAMGELLERVCQNSLYLMVTVTNLHISMSTRSNTFGFPEK
jgi:hypothetical protein